MFCFECHNITKNSGKNNLVQSVITYALITVFQNDFVLLKLGMWKFLVLVWVQSHFTQNKVNSLNFHKNICAPRNKTSI